MAETDEAVISLTEQFKNFAKFGDSKSDGKQITLSQSDKWMKQAHVIDGKKITTTDTGIYFKRFKTQKIGQADYEKFLDQLATAKKVPLDTIKKKLHECGTPGTSSKAAGAKAPGVYDRLTDSKKYTGSHKQRFDETGKGRGKEGRVDVKDDSGYVAGYKNKDAYNKQVSQEDKKADEH